MALRFLIASVCCLDVRRGLKRIQELFSGPETYVGNLRRRRAWADLAVAHTEQHHVQQVKEDGWGS